MGMCVTRRLGMIEWSWLRQRQGKPTMQQLSNSTRRTRRRHHPNKRRRRLTNRTRSATMMKKEEVGVMEPIMVLGRRRSPMTLTRELSRESVVWRFFCVRADFYTTTSWISSVFFRDVWALWKACMKNKEGMMMRLLHAVWFLQKSLVCHQCWTVFLIIEVVDL